MNTEYIVQKEGYRLEDLTGRHQEIIEWLRFVEKEFEASFGYEYEDYENDGLQKRLYNEVAREIVKDAVAWLHIQINEVQISLAESEEPADA